MTTRCLSFFIFIVVRVAYATERETTPFASVVHRGDVIVVTLSTSGARFAITDSPRPRVTAPGESFPLHDGVSIIEQPSLELSRHVSYRIASGPQSRGEIRFSIFRGHSVRKKLLHQG